MEKTIRKSCIAFLLLFCLCGCSGKPKSEYYIDPPKDSDFNPNSVAALPDSDIDLIREFIPKAIEWYNSVDISEPQSLDFVTEEINDLGIDLANNELYLNSLSSVSSGTPLTDEEREDFKQISTVNAIYGQIAGVIMTNDMQFDFVEDTETTIQIEKESWVELGDKIKEAIQFYYN